MAPLEKSISISLYDFLKKKMFVASTISLVGTETFRLNPGLVKTYWDFDDGFLMTAIGLPKVLIPKQYAALDRMLQASKRWIDSAYSQLDPKESDAEWEGNFGSKFIRKMTEVLAESGVSREGQAVAMLPLIWAINSNAIPCAGWMIFEILKHPGLFQRLREEVSPFMTSESTGKTRFYIPNLVFNSPLLTSLYLETIRTCTSSSPTRRLMQDLEVDGYILKKDNHIMASSWIPAHSTIWDVPGHPANSFWPERFIEMPKMKPKDPEEKSADEIAMRPENFFPYGGGNVVCSGRFFAKQEIMTAVALLVMKFDFDFEGGWVTKDGKTSERGAKCNESLAGSGVLTRDRDMVVKMKRVR
ncbi:hypothetical protein HYALB_00003427 [Hymenoscyphus albidus]|uniref:Cytochrome P450 n=1 Tax=Hymenoscyphus albidus TaxID=595503 RepID=A0A9N9LDJ7_9HELO|nr:hypothetical protein HYALB_00003427 [Hymenoscyphus albidus]